MVVSKIKTFLFWWVVSLALVSCQSKDAVELSLRVNKGDKYRSTVKMDQNIESSMFGKSMNINQKITMYQDFEVLESKDSNEVSLYTVFSRIIMDQNMPMLGTGMKMKFDSDNMEEASAEGKMMGELMTKLIGQGYTIVLDKKGKLISTDVQQLYKALFKDSISVESNLPSDNMEQYFCQLPEKAIRVGESFTNESKTGGEYPMTIKSKYTTKEITDTEVVFDVESEIGLGSGTAAMIAKMEGKQNGIVKISRETGLTTFSEITQNVFMTMGGGAMSIPMKLNGTTTFELNKTSK